MTFKADRPKIKVRVLELCEETDTHIAGGVEQCCSTRLNRALQIHVLKP